MKQDEKDIVKRLLDVVSHVKKTASLDKQTAELSRALAVAKLLNLIRKLNE
jgi:uncharacterized tellurite resistance protein B-like protein